MKRKVTVAAMLLGGAIAGGIALAQGPGGLQPTPGEIDIREDLAVPAADTQTEAMVAAAQAFLATLSEEQRAAAVYDFDDNAQRSNWSNFPDGVIERGGVMLGDLDAAQTAALDALLGTVLSPEGVTNIEWQLIAEDTLGSGGRGARFGSQYYYTSFLGEPASDAPWMFQFGGHHLAINVTIAGPDVTFSPMLTGGQPLNMRSRAVRSSSPRPRPAPHWR